MSSKGKLTLSVSREVVKRAKELGLNISEYLEASLNNYAPPQPHHGCTKPVSDDGCFICHDCEHHVGLFGYMIWCVQDRMFGDPDHCETMVYCKDCLHARRMKFISRHGSDATERLFERQVVLVGYPCGVEPICE